MVPSVSYHQGSIFSSPALNIYHLYVGDFSSSKSLLQTRSLLDYLGSYIADSDWYDGIKSYYQVIGRSVQNATQEAFFMKRKKLIVGDSSTPSLQAASFNDGDIQRAIVGQLKTGSLPLDSSATYMVLFRGPFNVTGLNNKLWLQGWCGYHSSFVFSDTTILYGVIGDPTFSTENSFCISAPTASSALPNIAAANMGTIYASTLANIITNPTFSGWYSNNNVEVGNICSPNYDTFVDTIIGPKNQRFRFLQVYRIGYGCWPSSGLVSVTPAPSVSPTRYLYPCASAQTTNFCNENAYILIPPNVTSIPPNSFAAYHPLLYVYIPTTVTFIGANAFSSNPRLDNVVIPTSISEITTSCFESTGITSISIPTSVTSIGPYAFAQNNFLSILYLPTSLTALGSYSFSNCPLLECVINLPTFPYSSTVFQGSPFALGGCPTSAPSALPTALPTYFYFPCTNAIDCGSQPYVTIASQVKTVASHAFYGSSSIIRVLIPTTVTAMGEYAFGYCPNLESVFLPTSLTDLPDFLFSNSSIRSLTIPTSVTSLGIGVCLLCFSLLQAHVPTSLTSIPLRTFSNTYSMLAVNIPTTVSNIDDKSFQFTSTLKSITIPTSLRSIPSFAFQACGLTSLVLPTTISFLDTRAFFNCAQMESVVLPTSLVSTGCCVFMQTGLVSVVIPTSIPSFESGVFLSCVNLVNVTIPTTMTNIPFQMFENTSLRSIVIPTSVTEIGDQAFSQVVYLSSIQFPTSITSIAAFTLSMFPYIGVLSYVGIPTTVTYIGIQAFQGVPLLTEITIPTSVVYIAAFAFNQTSVHEIVIPTSVTTLSQQNFMFCPNITKVVLPTSLKEIDIQMFYGSTAGIPLTIVIPSSITRIRNYSFADFTNLHKVVIPSSVRIIEDYAFAFCRQLVCVGWNNATGVQFNLTIFEGSPFLKVHKNISDCALRGPVKI